jgi:hypothetical protein
MDRAVRRRSSRRSAEATDEAAWRRAANDIAAAMLSQQLRTFREVKGDAKALVRLMHGRIEEAKKELGPHAVRRIDCLCRIDAIIAVGSKAEALAAGVSLDALFDATRAVVYEYLQRRS